MSPCAALRLVVACLAICAAAATPLSTTYKLVVDAAGLPVPVPRRLEQHINLHWALGVEDPDTHQHTLSNLCAAKHHLAVDAAVTAQYVQAALSLAQPWCKTLPGNTSTPQSASTQQGHASTTQNSSETQDAGQEGDSQRRQLLQDVIVPGNPLDRTFNGYASDFDILALLTVALNFQQEATFAGRNNSANSARVQTFKGARFPFGVNFAVTNTFGAKTKGTMDFQTRTNRKAALADGSADSRAIAFPAVGDVEVVQGIISSAISQIRLEENPQPPPPPLRNQTLPRVPLDPKQIPKFVVQNVNLSMPQKPPPPPGNFGNLGTSIDREGKVNFTSDKGDKDKGFGAATGGGQGSPDGKWRLGSRRNSMRGAKPLSTASTSSAPTVNDNSGPEVPPSIEGVGEMRSGFGNLSVAGDGEGYKTYRPPDRIRTRLDQEEYEYYSGHYNDQPFESGDPAKGFQDSNFDYLSEPYVYIEYNDDYDTNGNGTRNSTGALRTGFINGTGGDYTIPEPLATNLPPFKIFLASSLEYGRTGQYAYFYTNYFRFLYTYYFAPQVIPATGVNRQRSVSYVKRDERASTAGQTQSQATGTEVAAVGNSISAATSNAITQSLQISDIFGNSTFTGPPNVLTRYSGSQASAVAFGRSYYYTQPGITLVDASTQASENNGYASGAAGGFTAYASGSQFAGVRGQALGVTGEVNLDWDVGGR